MTVASETSRSGPYTGNGVTNVFDYGFRILNENHLRVIRTENGVETVLVIDTDYIVSDVGAAGGGQITLVTPPTASQTITILRDVPFTQETDLENQGPYFAETVEEGFDAGVMRDQQLAERLDRAVVIPASADPSSFNELVEDVLRLADSADAIDAVANNEANINTVAGIDAAVVTVAGVANDIPIVAAVADEIAAIGPVASDIPTVAANVTDITNFADVYQGPKAADPALRNNGAALQEGDLYFSTALKQMRVFDGEAWLSTPGLGDMRASTYDPTGVAGDAFDYGNMRNAPRRYIGFYNGQGPNTTPANVYNIGVADAVDPKSWGRRGITAPTWDQAAVYKDNKGRQGPCPIIVGNRIFVYYEGYTGTSKSIFLEIYDLTGGLAEKPIQPVIEYSSVSGAATVTRPSALYDPDDVVAPFKMVFAHSTSGLPGTSLWAATSQDGVTWAILGQILAVSSGWESTYLSTCRMIKDGGTYRLFYSAHDGVSWQSGEANNTAFTTTGWTKNAQNPLLERVGGYDVALAADISGGTRTVKVANSSLFNVGAPVAYYAAGSGFQMNRIAAIPDGTTITLRYQTEGSYTVSSGAKISQIYSRSSELTDVWYEDGKWRALTTHFHFVNGQVVETTGYAETPDLNTKFTPVYDVWPLPLNSKLKTWDQISAENLKFVRVQ